MKFKRSFKDNNNIYFLNEYVKGLELFDVIREIGYYTLKYILINSSKQNKKGLLSVFDS